MGSVGGGVGNSVSFYCMRDYFSTGQLKIGIKWYLLKGAKNRPINVSNNIV